MSLRRIDPLSLETLVRRDKKWFRNEAPDKQLFKKLLKILTAD